MVHPARLDLDVVYVRRVEKPFTACRELEAVPQVCWNGPSAVAVAGVHVVHRDGPNLRDLGQVVDARDVPVVLVPRLLLSDESVERRVFLGSKLEALDAARRPRTAAEGLR